jgi:hypothetical protein
VFLDIGFEELINEDLITAGVVQENEADDCLSQNQYDDGKKRLMSDPNRNHFTSTLDIITRASKHGGCY